jgi:hypothetical protein
MQRIMSSRTAKEHQEHEESSLDVVCPHSHLSFAHSSCFLFIILIFQGLWLFTIPPHPSQVSLLRNSVLLTRSLQSLATVVL